MASIADELKRYVRFTDADATRLQALHAAAAPHFERMARQFYERVREHGGAHAVLVDEAQVTRLQASFVAWLQRLLGGTYDEAYFERTRLIGAAHVRVGLPQRYVPVAMCLVREELFRIAETADPEYARETCASVCRILDIEMAVMAGASWDVLEERLQRALREQAMPGAGAARNEQRYASALELAAVAMVGLGPDQEVLLFNAEASRLSGYAKDEALGRRFEELLLGPDDTDSLAALARVSARAGGVHEGALRTRAGKLRQVRWLMGRVPGEGGPGELVHLLMVRDITDEHADQQRMRAQERLAAAGTLAAGLAHELRNPLNGAQLHLSLLQRSLQAAPPDIAEAVQATAVVRDEVQRVSKLVTDFLEIARPRPLQLAAVDVQDLCRRCAQRAMAGSSGEVRVDLDLPTTPVTVEADAARIEEALVHVLDNALEAVAPTGGRVTLRVRRAPQEVVLEIEDEGPGIPGDGSALFDAFYTTKASGTGLGLTIVHRAVTDHRGTIGVDSRPGLTRFRLTLPLQQ